MIGVLVSVAVDDYASCTPPTGAPIQLKSVSDGSNEVPIGGASVTGNVVWLCPTDTPPGYFTQYSSINVGTELPNGTANLGAIVGNYSLIVHYMSNEYPVSFSSNGLNSKVITVRLPSGHAGIAECNGISSSDCSNETTS